MENVIITHGYAHRLRSDGLIESAPYEKGTFGIWELRSLEEMDLSGGDWSVIQETLEKFRDIFSFVGRRTPVISKPQSQGSIEPSSIV